MNAAPGEIDFINRYLQRCRIRTCVSRFVLAVPWLGFGIYGCFEVIFHGPSGHHRDSALALYFCLFILPGALGLALLVRKVGEMFTPLARQADGNALRRYGEPQQILAAVNAEMDSGKDVVRIGERQRSFQLSLSDRASPYSAEVYLTPSWLVCFTGMRADHLTIFRLADVVLAARRRAPWRQLFFRPLSGHAWITLLDRQGVRLDVPLTRASATRLLAEVVVRTPRALGHFNPTTPPETDAGLGRFIAEVDRRREEHRVTGRKPPTSPS